MNTLANAINKKPLVRDANGVLTEQSPEEIQSLSAKAGLASPPLTPLGAQMIGANQDQAKMAGTPNQKASALSIANKPGETLSSAIRRGQGNEATQGTAAQESTKQKSQDVQALGGLGDRVTGFIDAQRAKLAAAQAPVEVGIQDQFNGKDVTQIKPLLDQLRQNPSDMNLQLQVNQALGYDVNSQLSPDQINSLYKSATEAIASGTAGNVDDHLNVQDLISQGNFGYDLPTLSHLLELPENQVSGMSVGQIRDQVNLMKQREFSTSQSLQQKATSNELGSAERAVAGQAGRESSRTGLRSAEADVAHLEQQIQNADQVQFGGKAYSVEDLLKDDTMSGIVTDYLNAAPGSEQRKQLEQTEPSLIQFIQKNQKVLEDAAESLSKGASGFQDIQSYNKGLTQGLPENLAKLVVPEAGSLQSSKADIEKKPLVKLAQSNPAVAQKLVGIDDRDAATLAPLNPGELQFLQIDKPGGRYDQYVQNKAHVQADQQWAEAPHSDDEVVDHIFDGHFTGSMSDLDAQYTKQQQADLLGLPSSTSDFGALDPSHTGHLSAAQLQQQYGQRVGDYSLADALQQNKPTKAGLSVPNDASNKWNDVQSYLYSKLQGSLGDGKIDSGELMNSGLDANQMMLLNWDAPALRNNKGQVAQAVSQKAIQDITKKNDMTSLSGLTTAYNDLLKTRDSLSGQFAQRGLQNGEGVANFRDSLTSLSAQIDAMQKGQNSTAAKAAADAAAAKEKDRAEFESAPVVQDKGTGQYYKVVNGKRYASSLEDMNRQVFGSKK